jgi:hypothetical protein
MRSMDIIKEFYIASVNRTISIKEFENKYYKVGHAYQINPRYFHKCVGYKGCFPIVETILFLDKVNDGHIQLIYNPGNTSHAIPSLDFVNDVMGGKIKEIPVSQYDMLYNKLSKYSSELAEMAEEIYSK